MSDSPIEQQNGYPCDEQVECERACQPMQEDPHHSTSKELERIKEERAALENELKDALARKKIDKEQIESLKIQIRQLDNLAEIEDPVIKSKAMKVLMNGDPVEYLTKVYSRLHVGDITIGKILLLSIACQSVLNSEGIQPKLSGTSGKGKTHAASVIFHLVPDVGYKLEGSLSAKSLFYHPDMKPGTITYSDDARMSDDLEDTLKRSMTKYQHPTIHRTVTKEGYRELEIPERTVWWLTSVDNPYSDELLNRLFGLDVDESSEQDSKVTDRQLEDAKYGRETLPEDEEIKVGRAIIHAVHNQLFKVVIPFAKYIEWLAPGDRRNLPRFLDLIRSFAAFRFMQRFEFEPGVIFASLKDFGDAKVLYEQGKAGQTTKLTKSELKLVEWMAGKSPLSINNIVKEYRKPNGSQYSYEAIRRMIEGTRHGKGLIYKVPGMLITGSGGKGDEKKYEISSFDDKQSLEIVTLKPVAYEKYKEEI